MNQLLITIYKTKQNELNRRIDSNHRSKLQPKTLINKKM